MNSDFAIPDLWGLSVKKKNVVNSKFELSENYNWDRKVEKISESYSGIMAPGLVPPTNTIPAAMMSVQVYAFLKLHSYRL